MEPTTTTELPAWLAGIAALVPGFGFVAAVVVRAARLEARLEELGRVVLELRGEIRELRGELREQHSRVTEVGEGVARLSERQDAIDRLRSR